jgi:hypothetical protein
MEHALAAVSSDKSITKKNRELILAYIKFRNVQALSIPRQVRYLFSLRKLARLLDGRSFTEATRENLGRPFFVESAEPMIILGA